uniref:Uncharacterized protein n=1 Tax=Fibrocapsa japonica TaxID=94617 RepID=A0A7S2XYI0_9STRA|mmetsp:Transcript_3046/g.4494  ORF Transcript_3046/g.4494 Transcript_3046/m.4494 type:complete len:300 (+) Transcript_3046:112-1011(+)
MSNSGNALASLVGYDDGNISDGDYDHDHVYASIAKAAAAKQKVKRVKFADSDFLEVVHVFEGNQPVDPSVRLEDLPPPPSRWGDDPLLGPPDTTGDGDPGLHNSLLLDRPPSAAGEEGQDQTTTRIGVPGDGGRSATSTGAAGTKPKFATGFSVVTTTVVRRKKLTPPAKKAVGAAAAAAGGAGGGGGDQPHPLHHYPKDIWPGAHPHTKLPGEEGDQVKNTEKTDKDGSGLPSSMDGMEFFCDHCQYTIEEGEGRFECRICPDAFCFCASCFKEHGRTHPHPMRENKGPLHVKMAVYE